MSKQVAAQTADAEPTGVIIYTNGTIVSGNRGFTPLAYLPPADITFEQWESDGEFIRAVERMKNFFVGDWLNAGEWRWGEKYAQALDEFQWGGMDKLRKLAWVARNVPPQNRRMGLTWSHHHAVASIDNLQEQADWLDWAEAHQMTAADLSAMVKESRAATAKAQVTEIELPVLPITEADLPAEADRPMQVPSDRVVPEADNSVGGYANGTGPTHADDHVPWDTGDVEEEEDGRYYIPSDPRLAARMLYKTFDAEWCAKLAMEIANLMPDYQVVDAD